MIEASGRLTREELVSLRRLAMGTASVFIPIGHLDTLRRLRLIEKTAGGEVVTAEGLEKARAAQSASG